MEWKTAKSIDYLLNEDEWCIDFNGTVSGGEATKGMVVNVLKENDDVDQTTTATNNVDLLQ